MFCLLPRENGYGGKGCTCSAPAPPALVSSNKRFMTVLSYSPKQRKAENGVQTDNRRGSIPTSTKRVSAKSEYVTEDAARISGAMRLPLAMGSRPTEGAAARAVLCGFPPQ